MKDTRAYLLGLQRDADLAAARHNKLHPGDQFSIIVQRDAALRAQLTPEQCAQLATKGTDWLGKKWQVETRPTPESITDWAGNASECSKYIPMIPPMYLAIGGLLLSTWMMVGPMMDERNAKAKGIDRAPQPAPKKTKEEKTA